MKLLYCPECGDIVCLAYDLRKCHCGKHEGKYKNELKAYVSEGSICIGISNPSFMKALQDHLRNPERRGDKCGIRFEAFVIEDNARSITREEQSYAELLKELKDEASEREAAKALSKA